MTEFCSYFPNNTKLCINGNEYAKCQLRKRGIEFEALDNGVLSCADPKALQRICDALDDKKIDRPLRKWLARLPHPFDRRDRAAGYRYTASILQAEFALTQVPDRPVAGRIFFEQVIRENLDIGRPGQVQLITPSGPAPPPARPARLRVGSTTASRCSTWAAACSCRSGR